MTKYATVSSETTVIAHTGRGYRLPAGTYEVADLDGTADRGELFLYGPEDRALVQANPHDPNIIIGAVQ